MPVTTVNLRYNVRIIYIWFEIILSVYKNEVFFFKLYCILSFESLRINFSSHLAETKHGLHLKKISWRRAGL
jgi:hypothetical protein